MVEEPPPTSRANLTVWINRILRRYGIRARKRLSQVFLVEPEVLQFMATKIREALESEVEADRSALIEIGSGVGNLTHYVAAANVESYIIGIEVDARLAPALCGLQRHNPHVDIVVGDALQLINSIRAASFVFGNLPYHITSELLLTIAKSAAKAALITVQKDVAEKLLAAPGTKSYGKLSLIMQYLFEIKYLRTIPPKLFKPSPEVYSSIILLKRRRAFDFAAELVEALSKCLFSYRRKNVIKALNACTNVNVDEAAKLLKDLGGKRVYELTPNDVERIALIIAKERAGTSAATTI